MRIAAVLLGLVLGALAAPPASHAGSAADRAEPITVVARDRYFSPDGDGADDRTQVVYRLRERAYVTVLVRDRRGDVVLRRALGVQDRERHAWRWDGRSRTGRTVPDGSYIVVLRAQGQGFDERARTSVSADTVPDRGRLVLSRPVVYPAATAVADRFSAVYVREDWSESERLYGYYYGDRPVRLTARFVLVDADGHRVLDRRSTKYTPSLSWTARTSAGRPLAPGTYTLRVTLTDEAGNQRNVRRVVEVSDAQLQERVWTTTIQAAAAEQGPGPVYDPACNGCGEVCGPVASDRYPGGLSFRQPCDFGYAAQRWFAAAAPVVPAPVDAFRVTATGGPTTPGDTDVAHVSGLVMGPGDVSVTTPWSDVDLDAHPYLAEATRPITWGVSTDQLNDYDIAGFTLEYRYFEPVP